jgi:hypothetical protein
MVKLVDTLDQSRMHCKRVSLRSEYKTPVMAEVFRLIILLSYERKYRICYWIKSKTDGAKKCK